MYTSIPYSLKFSRVKIFAVFEPTREKFKPRKFDPRTIITRTSHMAFGMALHNYFKRIEGGNLPDTRVSISKVVPSSAISAANSEVKARGLGTSKRGSYAKLTQQHKAEIGKRAAEHGIASTVRYYAKRLPDCPLKESSVRTWRNSYTLEIRRKRGERCEDMSAQELPEKKRDRPLLLGEELDRQVRAYLTSFRENGAVVNTAIAIGQRIDPPRRINGEQVDDNFLGTWPTVTPALTIATAKGSCEFPGSLWQGNSSLTLASQMSWYT